MPMFYDSFHDAPLADSSSDADATDFYLYEDPSDNAGGKGDAVDAPFTLDLFDTGEPAAQGDSEFDLGTDAADVFVFFSSPPGTASASSDPATPAPPEPPKQDPEPQKLDGARHSAIGAMLQRWLIYG